MLEESENTALVIAGHLEEKTSYRGISYFTFKLHYLNEKVERREPKLYHIASTSDSLFKVHKAYKQNIPFWIKIEATVKGEITYYFPKFLEFDSNRTEVDCTSIYIDELAGQTPPTDKITLTIDSLD